MLNNKLTTSIHNLLLEVLKFEHPTDKTISYFFRLNKNFGSQERFIIAETIYTILRNYYKLSNLLGEKNYYNFIGFSWVNLLHLEPNMYEKVTNIDFKAIKDMIFKDNEGVELPSWIYQKLSLQMTMDELQILAKSMEVQAPLDLRINVIKTNRNTVIEQLTKEGLEPVATPISPYGIRLTNKIFLAKHQLFTDGHIEVQDESSQIAGLLLNPKRGEMVVDFCAGSGGKTLLLGMLMRNTGRIYAFDVNEKRLNNLTPRLKRSGLSNVHPQLISHENDSKVKRLHNKIDKVFVDAPCLGLGTLRRNPDLKFRQTEQSLVEINHKQISILTAASKLVKVNGYIVYATCSILKEENQDIVETFLQNNSNFKLIPAETLIKTTSLKRDDGYLVLLPHLHTTDGFFAALMERIA